MSFYSYEDDFGAEMYPRSDYEKYIRNQEPVVIAHKPLPFVPRKEEKKEIVQNTKSAEYSREDIMFFAIMLLVVLNLMQYNMLQQNTLYNATTSKSTQ